MEPSSSREQPPVADSPEAKPSSSGGGEGSSSGAGSKGKDKEECAWCKYMKGGGCREPFEAWQACVDATMGDDLDDGARRAAVENCSSVTKPLFECMMRHRDYYGPQLAGMGGGGGDEPAASGGGGGAGGSGSGAAPPSSGGGGSSGGAGSSRSESMRGGAGVAAPATA